MWLWLACVVALPVHATDTRLHVFLDRDSVDYGDTVTLNVEMDGAASFQTPDLSALRNDFDILGTSHNSRVDIRNGHRRATTIWAVQLRPRHVGRIRIAPLSIDGQRTTPLTLQVKAPDRHHRGGPGDPVFLDVKVDTRTPYVGQQVVLTVRLFYTAAMARGSLDMPQDDAVELQQLGGDTRYQTRRDGRFYDVLERHYALVAQRKGRIDLAPVVFQGLMRGGSAGGGWFGNMREVSALSGAVNLDVRDKPAVVGADAWLPARSLTLTLDGLPADGTVPVGQPLTLTLTETARGLAFESLPEPALPPLQGADVYPDPTDDDTGHDGHWLKGTRRRTFTVVPRRPGKLTLPPITLTWWNLDKDRAETARVPAHSLTVVAAAGGHARGAPPTSLPAPPTSTPAPAGSIAAPATPATRPSGTTGWWPWVAAVAGGLWLVTCLVAAWRWRRRRAARAGAPGLATADAGPSARHARRAFLDATGSGDAAACCRTLLQWAQAERAGIRNLAGLARRLEDDDQVRLVGALQDAHYGTANMPRAEALRRAFAGGLRWRDDRRRGRNEDALPPLYHP